MRHLFKRSMNRLMVGTINREKEKLFISLQDVTNSILINLSLSLSIA